MLNELRNNPKKVALLDGLGALLTAFCLGFIMIKFNPIFGMPKSVLYYLALIALLFAGYSLGNNLFRKKHWNKYLITIIILNVTYCILSIGLLFYHFSSLTKIGLSYFILEIIVVLGIVYIEKTALNRIND